VEYIVFTCIISVSAYTISLFNCIRAYLLLTIQTTDIWSLVCKTKWKNRFDHSSRLRLEIKCGGLLLNLDSSCIEHYRVYSLCHHLAADISKGNEFLFVIDLTYTHLIVDLIYWQNLGRKLLGFFIKLIVALWNKL